MLDIENKGKKLIKVHEDVNSNIYTTGVLMRNVSSEKDVSKLQNFRTVRVLLHKIRDCRLLKDKSGVDKIIVKKQPYKLLSTNREFFPSVDASNFS